MTTNRTESIQIKPNDYKQLQIAPNHFKSNRISTNLTELISTNRTESWLDGARWTVAVAGEWRWRPCQYDRRRRRRPIKTRGTGSTPTPIITSLVVLPCRSYLFYALHSTPAHQSHRHAIHSIHCQGRYSVHQYYCPSTRGDPSGPKLYGKYHPMIPIRLGN